ncbi:unnamed protein product [Ceutorhynchus assimilis]|uniref:Phospholipid scramblase n=1 Tax=Ceutorhynchus assimilis TaxID=467358 RepID=A0A9N9MVP0_9CUCU|nr:unnamed protein product [Ceutorhynchus assimilis]
MKKNYPTSAQRTNPSDEHDETASPSNPRPPIVHQPTRRPIQNLNPRTYRDFDFGWMPLPKNIQNCPAGLEYLATIDQLLVRQELEFLEIVTGIETENRYTIKNATGQKIYYAQEESNICNRLCCYNNREFNMHIFDQFGYAVIRLYRPWLCCLQSLAVFSPPNNFIGAIEQKCPTCIPIFEVKDVTGITVLRIEGPCCTSSCFNDVDFKIVTGDGRQQIGVITKQWSGLARELFTDADYFGIRFPMDLDVAMKVVMLGACFLIDFMYFENERPTPVYPYAYT